MRSALLHSPAVAGAGALDLDPLKLELVYRRFRSGEQIYRLPEAWDGARRFAFLIALLVLLELRLLRRVATLVRGPKRA